MFSLILPASYRLLFFGLTFGWVLLGGCTPHTEDAVYVLPDAFEGNVVVLFDQPDGMPPEYSNKYRVYRIPQSGVLKTQFKSDRGGFAAAEYYYASQFKSIGHSATRLPYVNALNTSTTKLAATTIVCFNQVPFTQGQVRGDVFTVSRVAQADSVIELRQDLIEQVLPPFPVADSLGTSARNP